MSSTYSPTELRGSTTDAIKLGSRATEQWSLLKRAARSIEMEAETARQLAEKLAALHVEIWRLTSERQWNVNVVNRYREWWHRRKR